MKRAFLIILVLVGTVTGQFNQDTLKRWMKMGPPVEFILIDLRGPQDNITQVIANDKCKPYNLVWPDEFKSLIPKIPKDKHIVVYCRSGARSVQGASYLTSEGFSNVHDAGGFMNWTDTVRNISESIMADSLLPAPSMVPFTGVNMSIDKSVVATKSKAYTGVCLQRNYFNDESGVTLHGRIVHGVHNASNIHLYKYVNVYR